MKDGKENKIANTAQDRTGKIGFPKKNVAADQEQDGNKVYKIGNMISRNPE